MAAATGLAGRGFRLGLASLAAAALKLSTRATQVKRRRYFENTQDIKKRKLSARFKKVFRCAVGDATSHFSSRAGQTEDCRHVRLAQPWQQAQAVRERLERPLRAVEYR